MARGTTGGIEVRAQERSFPTQEKVLHNGDTAIQLLFENNRRIAMYPITHEDGFERLIEVGAARSINS